MLRQAAIFSLFYLIRVSTSLLEDSELIQKHCEGNQECPVDFFCCGSCDQTYCCKNEENKFNATKCMNMDDENTAGPSITMIGAILGGMIGSFIFAIILQHSVQNCLRKARSQRSAENGNVHKNENVNQVYSDSPPIYEDVHLYRQPDRKPKSSSVATITIEVESDINPPPSYTNLFNNKSFEHEETSCSSNIQEIEVSTFTEVSCQSHSTISSTVDVSSSRQSTS